MPLYSAIVKSLIRHAGNFGGGLVGVPIAGDIVVDAWDIWRKEADLKKMRAELEAYARQSVQDALAEAKKALAAEGPNLAEAVRQQIIDYISLVPGSIRRSLRRPADHTGRTVPPGLALRSANDLLPFLPAKLPLFKAGDRPLPHTDLELLELVGQGGFGEVWKAQHLDRPKTPPVALKFCLDGEAAKFLENECNLLDGMANDGIVKLLITYFRASPICLEYEYIEGGDLTGLIADLHEKGKPDANLVGRIILRLARTMAYAHQQKPPVIHRDLKPANILVRRTGQKFSLKIADFGIGALASQKAILDDKTGRTKSAEKRMDTLLGAFTMLYASQEQINGCEPDPRDDIHALGIIWYQMQTGKLSLMALPAHWREDLVDSGMGQGLIKILAACIGKLKDRPRDARDLAQLLEKVVPPSPDTAKTYITRLCWNTNGWTKPSGAESGDAFAARAGFGYDEWLASPRTKMGDWCYGYLQGVDHFVRNSAPPVTGHDLSLVLFAIGPHSKRVLVGRVICRPLSPAEKNDASEYFKQIIGEMKREIDDVGGVSRLLKPPFFNVRYLPNSLVILDKPVEVPTSNATWQQGQFQLFPVGGEELEALKRLLE